MTIAHQKSQRQRVVVTGIGLCTPIGNSLPSFAEQLRQGKSGIRKRSGIFEDRDAWVAMVEQFSLDQFSGDELKKYDRTALMGIFAATRALADARIPNAQSLRNAVVCGTSHGGRSQLDRFIEGGSLLTHPDTSQQLLRKAAHHFQAAAIATHLKLHGPCITLSNACSSSGAAIAYAMELLRSGECDWVLAGGADGFSKLTYAGFESLGAMADGPCAPFSNPIGMSLGDGAGFLFLETEASARKRQSKIYAELYGWGLSWDAYHITAPEPSGEGMNAAISMAVADAGIPKDRIDYVNIHGTGTRANDAAEAVGLQRYFADSSRGVPPLSASKSLTGHMLGASSALGVIASIVGMNEKWLPPTANFEGVRPGCELDAVPNEARPAEISYFMAQSAAFAGANAVIIGGQPDQATEVPEVDESDTVITGIGVVSPAGCHLDKFLEAMTSGQDCLANAAETFGEEFANHRCGLVNDFQPRKLMPTLQLRRVDKVAAFATIAASLALKDAGLWPLSKQSNRIGLVAATTRGAASSYEKYLESVAGSKWSDASPVSFPNLVMSSMGGQVTASLGLRGITSTLVGGGAAGLQALAHAVALFKSNPHQDAVVVVASDELSKLFLQLSIQDEFSNCNASEGIFPGEGSVAFVLEKRTAGKRAYARVAGTGMTHDANVLQRQSSTGDQLLAAIEIALKGASIQADQLGSYRQLDCQPHCRQDKCNHAKDHLAKNGVTESSSMTRKLGFAESSSSLFNVAATLLDPHSVGDHGHVHSLVTADSDDGSNAAVVLEVFKDRLS